MKTNTSIIFVKGAIRKTVVYLGKTEEQALTILKKEYGNVKILFKVTKTEA